MIFFFYTVNLCFLHSHKQLPSFPQNINRMVSNTDVCEAVKSALSLISEWCIPRKINGLLGGGCCMSVSQSSYVISKIT